MLLLNEVLEWISTTNGIITLLTGLGGLITTAIGAYFAIRNWVKLVKEKGFQEGWNLVMGMADAAMKEVESSLLSGEDKKKTVIDSVSAGCKAAGLNIDLFLNQLSVYIDETISFVNGMKK